MEISEFADKVSHPLCEYFDNIPYHKENKEKSRIWFLSGDPTAYGAKNLSMPKQGYEIVKKYILDPNNHGYTDSKGTPGGRKAVLKIMKTKLPLTSEDVSMNHGVNMGLLAALMAFTNEGDEILVPQIGYPFFENLCPSMNRKAVPYKLKPQSNFQIDLEHAQTLVNQKTQFIFVINPSNPLGTVFSKQHMLDILKFANQKELPIVSDEVYYGQTFPGVPFYSFGELTEDVPVVVLSGMEKTFSVPGWSIAWTVIFDKHGYLDQIRKNLGVIGTIFLHPNKFVQEALEEIIDKVGLFVVKEMGAIQKVHDQIHSKINTMKGIKAIKAQGTIYCTIQIDLKAFKNIETDKQFVEKLLEEENINAIPLTVFGGNIPGFRILTCATPEFYGQFYSRLENFIEKHHK